VKLNSKSKKLLKLLVWWSWS